VGKDDDVRQVLETVQDSVLGLLSGFGQPPSLLRIQAGEVTVEVRWRAAIPVASPTVVVAEQEAEDELRYVCAPSVGVFYLAPKPGADPFVREGDPVTPGQQVGIVEAMKLMMPVTADLHGKVVAVLKNNGESVEYGERLFAVHPVENR
jgi:acetyl-CoA carboxylase biotin carboxyl carrier protein